MEKNFFKTYKPNTKEFWSNLWFYYKSIILSAGAVILIVIFTVQSCQNRVFSDVSIIYIGERALLGESVAQFQASAEAFTADVNQDGKVVVKVLNLQFNETVAQEEGTLQIEKADIEIAAGESNIILVDDIMMERYIAMDAFEPIEQFQEDMQVQKNDQGQVVLVDVTDRKIARDLAFGGNRLYMGIRRIPALLRPNAGAMASYEESKRILPILLSQ